MPGQSYDNKGYIQISREIFSGPRACEKRKFSPFEAQLDLYQAARYGNTPARQLIGGKMVTWERGELPASIRYLAGRWQWSKDRVERFLAQLVQENEIEIRQYAGQTVVAVCMLTDRVQQQGQQQGQQEQPQERVSEGNKDSGEQEIRTRTGHQPDRDKDKTVIQEERKRKKRIQGVVIFPFLNQEFLAAWQQWKDYKQDQFSFRYRSIASEQGALTDLAKMSRENEQTAIQIITQSINKGWKGLFDLKSASPTANPYEDELERQRQMAKQKRELQFTEQ